ncbi:DNA topoisomerase IV [Hanstruepera ponticola]|uniref:DNA topoisomerase IV n=1 Tax=Hanstruepera ponticola TaxID=2042995 RepID=UPI000CF18A91|nr:DNA topoisomerase IV [Hanstruepera ponticola]
MKPLYYFLLLLSLTGCYQIERNCQDYQLGTFKSEVNINDSLYVSSFTRTKTLQIETYNNKVDSSQVRWINDCEAIFKTINPKNRVEKKDIHLKILTTTDSSYTFEYSYVGDKIKQKGVAIKLN